MHFKLLTSCWCCSLVRLSPLRGCPSSFAYRCAASQFGHSNLQPPYAVGHSVLIAYQVLALQANKFERTRLMTLSAHRRGAGAFVITVFSSDDWCSPSSSVRKVRSLHLGLSGVLRRAKRQSRVRIGNLIRSAICVDLLSGTLRTFLKFPRIAFIYGANCVRSA